MTEYVITALVLILAAALTILANRILGEMKERGMPTGQGGCSGNPNCPLKHLEDRGSPEKKAGAEQAAARENDLPS